MDNKNKEKHMLEVRGKVRELYMNSGIGMEEILKVIANDSCYFTQYEGSDPSVYDFWRHIERLLVQWRKINKGKNLKIYSPDWDETSKNRCFETSVEIS